MEQVVNQCAAHLVRDLSIETSLETRALPGINRNKDFVSKVDQFIADHVRRNFIKRIDFKIFFFFYNLVSRAYTNNQLPTASIHPD